MNISIGSDNVFQDERGHGALSHFILKQYNFSNSMAITFSLYNRYIVFTRGHHRLLTPQICALYGVSAPSAASDLFVSRTESVAETSYLP